MTRAERKRLLAARPTYYMPEENRAFGRGWRDGTDGVPMRRSPYPNAYARGYNEGLADALTRQPEPIQ